MREKLIELQDSGNICPKGITSCLDCPYHKKYAFGKPCDEKAAIADRMIANGVTIQKWIPVSERLPEDYEDVLVYSGGVEPGWCDRGVFYEYDKYESDRIDGVTHWMPLPEPPKGE